jgi:hypothetical protein
MLRQQKQNHESGSHMRDRLFEPLRDDALDALLICLRSGMSHKFIPGSAVMIRGPFMQANFYQDASSMGEMSPFLLFDGDDDAKMDKRGMHSGKTDVAKKVCSAMMD